MTSATEELRRLLDDAGVEWGNVRNDGSPSDYVTEWELGNRDSAIATEWAVGGGLSVEICRHQLTPAQAVEATLGPFASDEEKRDFEAFRDGEWVEASVYRSLKARYDELEATLGRGKCHIVKTWSDSDYDEDWRYRCSECRGFIPVDERDPDTGDVVSAANFCPNCGMEVEL